MATTRLSLSATPGRPYASWVAKAEAVAVSQIYKIVAIVLNAYDIAITSNDYTISSEVANDYTISVGEV